MRRARTAILAIAFCLASSGIALAQESGDQDWKFQATVYGWLPMLSGDVGVAGLPEQHISVSIGDVLDHLDGALMGNFYVSKGKWMAMTDVIWSKLSDDSSYDRIGGTLKFEQTQLIVQGLVGYQLPLDVPDLQVSGTAGFRYQRLYADLDFSVPNYSIYRDWSGAEAWTDPTLGLWAHYDLSESWFVNGLVDVGGFGLGSRISSQGFAALGYNWNDTISTSAGYRALYIDYKDGGFTYNTVMQGPFIGLGIHF